MEKNNRSSIGISSASLIDLSRLCVSIREKGSKKHKHEVVTKMIDYFKAHPDLVVHLL